MPFLKDKRKLESRTAEIIKSSHKNGFRKSIFTLSNDSYIGDWSVSEKSGYGALLTRTFKLYEGEWQRNFRHGFGVLAWRDENKIFHLEYRGGWKNGCQHGFGAKHFQDGSFYLGYFKNNKRHGYGQMWFADGSYYDGNWDTDVHDGLGMWVRTDGNRYEGAWKNGLKHGKGRFFHLDSGQMQEGIWEFDICIFSTIVDIPFRQTAVSPTEHPIQTSELTDLEKVCAENEFKALTKQTSSQIYELQSLSNTMCGDTRRN